MSEQSTPTAAPPPVEPFRPYRCPGCGGRFPDARGLTLHLRDNRECGLVALGQLSMRSITSRCDRCGRAMPVGSQAHIDCEDGATIIVCSACYNAAARRAADAPQEVPV